MINLYLGDCMEAMAKMPDKAYDLAIVDPPYGIGNFVNSKSQKHHKKFKWNDSIPDEKYFMELKRITINRIIFGYNHYSRFIDDRGIIVHDKTGGGKIRNPKELSDCDIASHSFGFNSKIFSFVSSGNVIGNTIDWNNNLRWHPCQKPIELYKWLLKNYAKPRDKIIDTHGGSMSIAIACYDMGFDLDLWEIDPDYYAAGVKRFEQHKRQTKLFTPQEMYNQ